MISTSAAVCLPCHSAWADPAPKGELNDLAAREASAHFEAGLKHVGAGELRAAEESFAAAYDLDPHPNTLYNLALVQARLGRVASAVSLLRQHLKRAGESMPPTRRKRIETWLQEREAALARIVLRGVPPAASFELNGLPARVSEEGLLLLDPGEHTLRVGAPGFETKVYPLTLGEAEQHTLDIELQPSPASLPTPQSPEPLVGSPGLATPRGSLQAEPLQPPASLETSKPEGSGFDEWVALTGFAGVTLGLGAFTVQAQGNSRYGRWASTQRELNATAEEQPAKQARNDRLQRRIESGDRLAIALAVGGVAALGASAWLYFSGSGRAGPQEPSRPANKTPELAASCQPAFTDGWKSWGLDCHLQF